MSPNLDILIPLFVENGVRDGKMIFERIQEKYPSVTESDMAKAFEQLRARGKIRFSESFGAALPPRIDLVDAE